MKKINETEKDKKKAVYEYVNKYKETNYDRIYTYVKKGEKATYNEYAKDNGFQSLNHFIDAAMKKAIKDKLKADEK